MSFAGPSNHKLKTGELIEVRLQQRTGDGFRLMRCWSSKFLLICVSDCRVRRWFSPRVEGREISSVPTPPNAARRWSSLRAELEGPLDEGESLTAGLGAE